MNMKTKLILVAGLAFALLPAGYAKDDKLKDKDADNDGRITRAEFSGGSLSKFVNLDKDGDGSISSDELTAGQQKRSSGLKFWEKDDSADVAQALKEADTDGDGRITRAEHEAHVNSKFDSMDANKDGVLAEQELDADHKKDKATDTNR